MIKLKCPLLLNIHLKKNQQNYWSFYPLEPFKNGHFNVRHPVKGIVTIQTSVTQYSITYTQVDPFWFDVLSSRVFLMWQWHRYHFQQSKLFDHFCWSILDCQYHYQISLRYFHLNLKKTQIKLIIKIHFLTFPACF